jgi:hypothetical protein
MQPLLGLLVGAAILSFVGYMNWYGDIKPRIVRWIAEKIFRKGPMSEASADNLFMNITVLLLLVGFVWFGLAIGYLTA